MHIQTSKPWHLVVFVMRIGTTFQNTCVHPNDSTRAISDITNPHVDNVNTSQETTNLCTVNIWQKCNDL